MTRLCHKRLASPLVIVILAAFFCASFSFNAVAQNQNTDIRPQAQRIIGSALKEAFSGVKHQGAYNFTLEGKGQNTYSEMHFETGRVLYEEGEIENNGVWFIQDDTLCFVYEKAIMSGGCFRVYKVENCFYYYSDQIVEIENELDQEYWTARSVKNGQTPQCDAAIS